MNTPLWFYALSEAEFNGGRLAGVGGRIVAETFYRRFAFDGRVDLLNRSGTARGFGQIVR